MRWTARAVCFVSAISLCIGVGCAGTDDEEFHTREQGLTDASSDTSQADSSSSTDGASEVSSSPHNKSPFPSGLPEMSGGKLSPAQQKQLAEEYRAEACDLTGPAGARRVSQIPDWRQPGLEADVLHRKRKERKKAIAPNGITTVQAASDPVLQSLVRPVPAEALPEKPQPVPYLKGAQTQYRKWLADNPNASRARAQAKLVELYRTARRGTP